MEDTYRLISKLVQTKSIKNVISSIATKVSQLIILNEAYENGDTDAFVDDLLPDATPVLESTQELVQAATRLLDGSEDEVFKKQLPKACEALTVAGTNQLSAAQRVQIENYSSASRKHLIHTTKDVLEATLKVLLVTDDAEIRKITKAIQSIRERLGLLTVVQSMSTLVSTFKVKTKSFQELLATVLSFNLHSLPVDARVDIKTMVKQYSALHGEAAGYLRCLLEVHIPERALRSADKELLGFAECMMLLTSLIDRRQLELCDEQQREAILRSLGILKKSVPMLNSSLQTAVKYPNNPQAKTSKMYAVGQIMECLDNLEAAVQSKDFIGEEYEEPEMPGHFVSNIDRLLSLLGEENRSQLPQLSSDLDVVVESLVYHSMSVSHLSPQQHRTNIIRNARTLLKLRSELADLSRALRDSGQNASPEFDTKCKSMMAEAQQLENNISAATLWLVTDAFKETTEPLERLIKVMLSNDKETWLHYSSVEEYERDFHEHFDKVGQVARFTAATAIDAKKVRLVNNCLSILEHIDPELVPAVRACRTSPGDQGATEHLRLLKTEWINSMDVLLRTVDELTDGQTAIEISVSELKKAVERCKESQIADVVLVRDVTRSLIGRAARIGQRALGVVSSDYDAVYRNSIRASVRKLEKALPMVKTAASCVLRDINDISLHNKLHRACNLLLKYAILVKDGILRKSSSLTLDPDRETSYPDTGQDQLGELFQDFCDNRDDDDDGDDHNIDDDHDIPDHADYSGSSVTHHSANDSMKCYISDIIHDHLLELTRQLVSAAMGSCRQKLEILCNSLLSYGNHITEAADRVAVHLAEEETKMLLVDCSRKLNELTPQIIDKAAKVYDCDTYQIEPLHQFTDTWTKQASFLQSKLDTILVKWKHVSDGIPDAVKLSDSQLLCTQIKEVRSHVVHVTKIVDAASQLSSEMNALMIQKICSLKDQVQQLDSLTTDLVTRAENQINKSLSPDDCRELEQLSRSWAALLYHILASADELCNQAVISYVSRPLEPHDTDCVKLNQYISAVTEINITLKAYIESALAGCIIEKYIADGEEAMGDIDNVAVDITQCYGVLTGVVIQSDDISQMYASHQLRILLWRWAATVHRTKAMLTKWTSHCTGHINSCLQVIVKLHEEGRDDAKNLNDSTCRKCLDSIKEVYQKAARKVLDMIQASDNDEEKSRIRCLVESWSVITEELYTLGTSLLEDMSELKKEKFILAKLHWGVKCLEIDGCFRSLSGIKYDSISGFVRSLITHHLTQSNNLTNRRSDAKTLPVRDFNNTNKMKMIQESRSTAASRTDGDADWKKLASGPRVKHSTPIQPGSKSGFRPSSSVKTARKIWSPSSCVQWSGDDNAVVKIAHDISEQLRNMADFTKGTGPIKNKEELITTAKSVAKNGEKLVKFARVLVKYSIDKRVSEDLRCSADHIPTVIAQLNILAGVKSATPDDRSTEKMLVNTGNNLLDAINKMLRNAEAVCVKGLKEDVDLSDDESEALRLAHQWRGQLERHRVLESSSAPLDRLGLRQVSRHVDRPALSDILTSK